MHSFIFSTCTSTKQTLCWAPEFLLSYAQGITGRETEDFT